MLTAIIHSPSRVPSVLRTAAVGVAALIASVAIPSIAIAVFAAVVRDPVQITHMALRIAEPLASVGALATVSILAARRGPPAGVARGAAAALAIYLGALWTGDVDAWTGVTAAMLPIAGAVSGLRGSAQHHHRMARPVID